MSLKVSSSKGQDKIRVYVNHHDAQLERVHYSCDRKLPECSQCLAAGSTCTGFNSARAAHVPRSLIHYLEQEITRMERELGQVGHAQGNENEILASLTSAGEPQQTPPTGSTVPENRSNTTLSPSNATKESVRASAELQQMIAATIPLGPSVTDVVRKIRMGLTPSLVLSAGGADRVQSKAPVKERLCEHEVDASMIASLPTHVIHILVKKYMQRMLPVEPFLYEPTVWEQLHRVLEKIPRQRTSRQGSHEHPTVALDYDFLTIYLILAVSANLGSAKTGNLERCLAFSESLFKEGIRHLSQTAPYPSDMAWIQITLLILQYASINPRLGNVWILSGFAMRNCLELGLHREMPVSNGLDPLTMDMRRRIFWTAYCMDRSICATLQRPLSIGDAAINSEFPSILEDRCITSSGIDQRGQWTKQLALRWIQYRKLQSIIIEFHFQGMPLDAGKSWEEWLAETEEKLRAWYENDLPHDGWTEFALMHGLVMLYRPSPRIVPSPRNLVLAFKAACASASSCRKQLLSGYFPRPWLAAHHTFETGLVALYCLKHNYAGISEIYNPAEIFETTRLFTQNLLTISSNGWPEITEYAGIYEKLLVPVLDAILSRSRPVEGSHTLEQDIELTKLLFPSPTHPKELKFAGNRLEDFQDGYLEFDETLFGWDDDLLGRESGNPSMWLT
ncbi:hypothetical protein B7463_g4064, partial [Scytalidium lignicola]